MLAASLRGGIVSTSRRALPKVEWIILIMIKTIGRATNVLIFFVVYWLWFLDIICRAAERFA